MNIKYIPSKFLITSSLILCPLVNASVNVDTKNYDKSHKASSSRIGNFEQTRSADSWAFIDRTTISGQINDSTSFSLNSRDVKLTSGGLTLSFNPQRLNCTSGFNINFTLGQQVLTNVSPNCDSIISAEVGNSFNHNFDTPRLSIPAVPLDPWGVIKFNATAGVSASAGLDWAVGTAFDYSHFDATDIQGLNFKGTARPLTVYAKVKPWSKAGLDASATFTAGVGFLGIKYDIAEAGITGFMNLLDASIDAKIEAGIGKTGDENGLRYHGFARSSALAALSTGNGSIEVFAKLFHRVCFFWCVEFVKWQDRVNLARWPAIYSGREVWDSGYVKSQWEI